ncbi:hypothetical protein B0H17DRAFT_1066883 [Mycena rosella]|uniref:Uncharacterized protein n=1 Tax=Mycena rosella TaxID=1033263 RepID=A0AAD7DEK4_MYCRO|nr:hypothetical protein B0H17DRAFT_1066883 [Mycena rosella]
MVTVSSSLPFRADIAPSVLTPPSPHFLLQMYRPRSLDLPTQGSPAPRKSTRSPLVLPSPFLKRGRWPQQQHLMKFINRKTLHGTKKPKLFLYALRRRLLRRGLNFPRTRRAYSTQIRRSVLMIPTARTSFLLNRCDVWETTEPAWPGSSPILLPRLPFLGLRPETPDSGYCSDESLPSPCSTQSNVSPRPIRRYILPDPSPLAASPSDLAYPAEILIRLSRQSASPRIPPPRFDL